MAKGVSRSKEGTTNGATGKESDPLRAPVCRKGKLIGEVSTNWKALCQQLKLKSTEEAKDAAKEPYSAHELKVPVVGGGEAKDLVPPDKRKVKLQREERKRKLNREVESTSSCIMEDAKRSRSHLPDGRKCAGDSLLEGDGDGLGSGQKRSKMESTGTEGEDVEGVGEGRDESTDAGTLKPKPSRKRARKEKVGTDSTGVTQMEDVDIVEQGVKRKSMITTTVPEEAAQSKNNLTQVAVMETTVKKTKRARKAKDTEGEQKAAHTGKSSNKVACADIFSKDAGKSPENPPNEVTSSGEMKSLMGKAMNEGIVAKESGPNVRKKQSKDIDANLKLLQDSGDVFSKKRDTPVLGKRDPSAVMGSIAKKPADFWFDDVDLSDVGKTKRPRTSMLISGQDMSVGKCVALDCEMVGTGPEGYQSMLARCSVVNHHGNIIYDSFVAPMDTVTDYRTRYSGVRQEDLKDAPSFKAVQKKVSDLLKGRTLVGHGLKHDLKALLLSHPKKDTRDTISYKPFRALSQGKTPPLKKLASELLGVNIQEGEHSSIEDAQVAMRLYQKYKAEWEAHLKKRDRFRSGKHTTFGPGTQKPVKASQSSLARTKAPEKCERFNIMLQCD